MAKQKFYVVWEGRQPGVYTTWEDCQEQIDGYPGAKFRSFPSQEEAVEAFRSQEDAETELLLTHIAVKNAESGHHPAAPQPVAPTHVPAVTPVAPQIQAPPRPVSKVDYSRIPEINLNAIAVDGACSGNPGLMEYRGVSVATGEELFHVGPLADGTNNVAEYLAIIHGLAYLFQRNDSTTAIYTDSATAVAWVRNRGCRTQLKPTEANAKIFNLIARANVWIRTHQTANPILRWNTSIWGEIPADFARK